MIILDIDKEKKDLESYILKWFEKTKRHIEEIPKDLTSQVQLLSNIRKDLYEDLNQMQHAALIIKAAESLQKEFPSINKWHWHPKQTSHPDYADLTGYVDNEIFLNAEVTTSLNPVGTIDKRMMSTLTSLNGKSGIKFYYVVTEKMCNRAKSKKTNNGFNIEIRQIL
ncbi:hypothetical protein Q765_15795 [Flavobacterium rivuli WB 3.3-2 = DSM 21788]|uniref:Uncharacterized protein n=1 Tax=Flavobacterium rivuli WB 3.3-2 = DSM 21788 TaxID=1121895 RepID=A0A0A2M1Y6_9FLAO|nr:hypothetical protein [Flavobacterium rivuli]KGO85488.1 hypothetical protein Q765_15795 [Flavobacterium rivuli WB 3.3-2 = DSM 21788]